METMTESFSSHRGGGGKGAGQSHEEGTASAKANGRLAPRPVWLP